MRLGPRLSAVANLVPSGSRVADIGTDHARLPAHLLTYGVASHVIATDRSRAPLSRAAMNLAAHDRARYELRLGDGLQVLRRAEVDTVTIAGLGGGRIARLLDAAPEIVTGCARIVLQPEREWFAVRRWILQHDVALVGEALVEEGGRFRLVCAVAPNVRGDAHWSASDLWFGPLLRRSAPPTFRAWLDRERRVCEQAIAAARRSARATARVAELQARVCAIVDELERIGAAALPSRRAAP